MNRVTKVEREFIWFAWYPVWLQDSKRYAFWETVLCKYQWEFGVVCDEPYYRYFEDQFV